MYRLVSISIPLIAVICYGILLIVTLRQDSRRAENRFFAWYLGSLFVWSLGSLFMRMDVQNSLFWNKVMLSGLLGMPVALYACIRAFLGVQGQRWALYWGLAAYVVLMLLNVLGYLTDHAYLAVQGLVHYQVGRAWTLFAANSAFLIVLATLNLIWAYRHTTDSIERNRIKYAVFGIGVIVLGAATNLPSSLRTYPIGIAANILSALLLAYAILRYHPLRINSVVRKGVLYSIPTAIIGAGYFLLVFLAVNLFHLVTGDQVPILALLVAAIAAVVMRPLWNRIQSWVDRLFFREKYDASMMLQRLSRTAASVLDLDRLTSMILDELLATMRVGRAVFFLREKDTGEFRLAAQRGLEPDTVIRLRENHPLVTWLSEHERLLTRQEVDVAPQFRAMLMEEREDLGRIEAELLVPLRVRQDLIGILVMGPKLSAIPYSPDEQGILATLANQMAVAIEHAWLFSLEQLKAEESLALLAIAQAVGSTLNLIRLLEIVTQRTAHACGVDRCSIFLLDDEGGRLIPLMSQFADGAKDRELWKIFQKETYVESVDEILSLQQVLKGRQPAVFAESLTSLLPSGWIEPYGIKSLLAVPLISKDQVIGLMVLDHTQPDRHFTKEKLNLATTIAMQVSFAIENARLYEETIREKERTETIVNQAFAGIMVVDAATRIVTLNPEVETITGYTSEELLGKPLADIFSHDLCGEGSSLSQAMVHGERIPPVEAVLVGKNGARDILLGVTPIRDGFVLNFSDITHLKEVDRLKSSIVANVSHELRAPLASIKAYAELLLNNLEGEDRAIRHRFVSVIDQEADWLSELINSLLDLSRLESGRYPAQMRAVSMKDIVEGVIALLDRQIGKKEIEIQIAVRGELPLILADKELMTVLVKNLIGNAIKFSSEGTQVNVSMWEAGNNLVLQVADQGIGIPADELPLLFNKFFRSRLAKEAGIRGTGLGLVLAKEIAELHGSTIAVHSELGVGTCFTVTMPIRQEVGLATPCMGEGMDG